METGADLPVDRQKLLPCRRTEGRRGFPLRLLFRRPETVRRIDQRLTEIKNNRPDHSVLFIPASIPVIEAFDLPGNLPAGGKDPPGPGERAVLRQVVRNDDAADAGRECRPEPALRILHDETLLRPAAASLHGQPVRFRVRFGQDVILPGQDEIEIGKETGFRVHRIEMRPPGTRHDRLDHLAPERSRGSPRRRPGCGRRPRAVPCSAGSAPRGGGRSPPAETPFSSARSKALRPSRREICWKSASVSVTPACRRSSRVA